MAACTKRAAERAGGGPGLPPGRSGATAQTAANAATGPVGPVGLVGLVGLVGPGGPVGLVGPGGTVGPIGPVGTVGTVGPVDPAPHALRRPASRPARQRGAALLLLLAVAGLGAATLLISVFGKQNLEGLRERRTQARLAQAADALVGFAALHGRLPRPAVSATDGRENAEPCDSEAACSGFLPWVALGVDGADSWGKVLRYSVTPEYTRAPLLRISAVATKRVQTRDGQGNLFYVAGQDVCLLYAQCAPAVLYSQGRNNLGTSVAGLAQANGARGNVDEQGNDGAVLTFVQRAASDNPAAPGGVFDDLLLALPLQTLYERMAAARALP